MIARILAVEETQVGEDLVSYVLYDEAGSVLEHVDGAALDTEFWHDELHSYSAARQADPTLESVTVPLDRGIEVSVVLTAP